MSKRTSDRNLDIREANWAATIGSPKSLVVACCLIEAFDICTSVEEKYHGIENDCDISTLDITSPIVCAQRMLLSLAVGYQNSALDIGRALTQETGLHSAADRLADSLNPKMRRAVHAYVQHLGSDSSLIEDQSIRFKIETGHYYWDAISQSEDLDELDLWYEQAVTVQRAICASFVEVNGETRIPRMTDILMPRCWIENELYTRGDSTLVDYDCLPGEGMPRYFEDEIIEEEAFLPVLLIASLDHNNLVLLDNLLFNFAENNEFIHNSVAKCTSFQIKMITVWIYFVNSFPRPGIHKSQIEQIIQGFPFANS